jgi:hypothetical protein
LRKLKVGRLKRVIFVPDGGLLPMIESTASNPWDVEMAAQ